MVSLYHFLVAQVGSAVLLLLYVLHKRKGFDPPLWFWLTPALLSIPVFLYLRQPLRLADLSSISCWGGLFFCNIFTYRKRGFSKFSVGALALANVLFFSEFYDFTHKMLMTNLRDQLFYLLNNKMSIGLFFMLLLQGTLREKKTLIIYLFLSTLFLLNVELWLVYKLQYFAGAVQPWMVLVRVPIALIGIIYPFTAKEVE